LYGRMIIAIIDSLVNRPSMNKYLLRSFLVPLTVVVCAGYTIEATAQNKEEFDNLIFFVQQGFTISKSTNSIKLTDAAGEDFSITINKSTFSLKKIEKSFPLFWKESLAMDGFDDSIKGPQFVKFRNAGGWDCFRGGRMVSYSAQSTPRYYHLTVVKYLGITTRIITKASTEELFIQKMPLLMDLIASIHFKKQQQNSPSANGSSGYP
jgi:hypothetical protein